MMQHWDAGARRRSLIWLSVPQVKLSLYLYTSVFVRVFYCHIFCQNSQADKKAIWDLKIDWVNLSVPKRSKPRLWSPQQIRIPLLARRTTQSYFDTSWSIVRPSIYDVHSVDCPKGSWYDERFTQILLAFIVAFGISCKIRPLGGRPGPASTIGPRLSSNDSMIRYTPSQSQTWMGSQSRIWFRRHLWKAPKRVFPQ